MHLSNNNVPLPYVYYMDKELRIPETLGDKLSKFRPLDREDRKSTVISTDLNG